MAAIMETPFAGCLLLFFVDSDGMKSETSAEITMAAARGGGFFFLSVPYCLNKQSKTTNEFSKNSSAKICVFPKKIEYSTIDVQLNWH
jgi:hypothetical protein